MKTPTVSIVGPAINVELWQERYEELKHNNIDFELIFVGHIEPTFLLPDNFYFLKTTDSVTPAQCAELAIRAAKGKYIMWVCDDCYFRPGMLDKQVEELEKRKGEKWMVGVGYRGVYTREQFDREKSNKQRTSEQLTLTSDADSPLMPIFPMMLRTDLIEIGSIDVNFYAQYWDLDLVCRFYQIGGSVYQIPDSKYVTHELHTRSDLSGRSGGSSARSYTFHADRKYLDQLWKWEDKKLHLRTTEVESIPSDYFDGKYTKWNNL